MTTHESSKYINLYKEIKDQENNEKIKIQNSIANSNNSRKNFFRNIRTRKR